jgi:peptidoglycan/LPS O-acetylase OafA/YrhL
VTDLSFFGNRLLRIVPLFAVTVLVSFAALYALGEFVTLADETGKPIAGSIMNVRNVAANLLMIVPLPGRFAIEPDFTVLRIAWALRVEMAFYVSIAFLLFAGGGKFRRELSFFAAFNVAAAVLTVLSIWYLAIRPAWNPIIAFAPYFSAGGTLFFALRGSKPSMFLFAAVAVVSVIMTLDQLSDGQSYRSDVGATSLYVVLTIACTYLAMRKVPNPNLDRRLGDFSYPVYVGHWLPLLIFAALMLSYPSASGVAAELVTTGIGIGLPLCYFFLVEPATTKLRTVVRGVAIR